MTYVYADTSHDHVSASNVASPSRGKKWNPGCLVTRPAPTLPEAKPRVLQSPHKTGEPSKVEHRVRDTHAPSSSVTCFANRPVLIGRSQGLGMATRPPAEDKPWELAAHPRLAKGKVVVLDGWGEAPPDPFNCIHAADTPTLDALKKVPAADLIRCSMTTSA
jgi:hypothetical protein